MSRTLASRPGRVGRPWREVSARVYREETHCWLCGHWVDPALEPEDRMSRTADHLVQLSHGGNPHARDNLRLAHRSCNTARSNRLRKPDGRTMLDTQDCCCSMGLPCGVLDPTRKRGYLALDVADL